MSQESRKPGHSSDEEFTRRVFIVVAVGALVAAVWALSDIVLLLFGAVLLAITLRFLAAPLETHLGLGRSLALAATCVAIVAFVATIVIVLGPGLAEQMRGLFQTLPEAAAQIAAYLQFGSITDVIKNGTSASTLGNLVSRVVTWGSTVLGALASIVVVVFGGIYLAANPRLYREGFVKLVPPALHPNVNATLDDAGEALKRWLVGQLIAMVLVGTFTAIGLWLVGVPSALALGMIAGVAEFVPLVGPIAAAIPAVLIAGVQGWQTLLPAIGVLVVVQQVESNLITPMIADRMVSIAPAVGLFAILAMGVVFGPLGLLLGFPLAVALDVAVRRLYVRDVLGESVEIMGKAAKPSKRDA